MGSPSRKVSLPFQKVVHVPCIAIVATYLKFLYPPYTLTVTPAPYSLGASQSRQGKVGGSAEFEDEALLGD